ncbi:MAG: hypothetical protein U5P41_00065 [Gammaproteobacteria bacterium]|nr:hypothetical protein [Gammaproteobacteria bacterium]
MTIPDYNIALSHALSAFRGIFILNSAGMAMVVALIANRMDRLVNNFSLDSSTLSCALYFFAIGALFSVLCSGISFLSQDANIESKRTAYIMLQAFGNRNISYIRNMLSIRYF